MLNAEAHNNLLDSTSTLDLLSQLVEPGWFTAQESETLSQAYRDYREQVNRQALMVDLSMDEKTLSAYQSEVSTIWQRLMPEKEQ